ncbi:hypothetical protein ACHQM5_017414 [Ranunculus cassubicifolius]
MQRITGKHEFRKFCLREALIDLYNTKGVSLDNAPWNSHFDIEGIFVILCLAASRRVNLDNLREMCIVLHCLEHRILGICKTRPSKVQFMWC